MSRATASPEQLQRFIALDRKIQIEDTRWRIAADVAWLLEHPDDQGVKDHLAYWERVLHALESADE